ncbi:hypothetical protein H4219_002871 [Mycoemilia scoparia]|uniref:Guanine deaminase n=1 Tax=Mycoemilia scoparia TaxID=417184 RepID=A0A9W8DNK0_9FUNG|nr:hypothetical protein H4219_002871 [Mycoemilia scoparia]
MPYTVYSGCVVSPSGLSRLSILPNGLLCVDNETGKIVGVHNDSKSAPESLSALLKQWVGKPVDESEIKSVRLKDTQFLMPGFIDTHTHAPQFSFIGLGHDLPLMDWLEKYTFPHESDFKDLDNARNLYESAASFTIRNGTTCAAYYATIHLESCLTLVDILRKRGQRAFVGKVNMVQNAPDFYIETLDETMDATVKFIEEVARTRPEGVTQDSPLDIVKPIITPRFAPSCTMECLKKLAKVAKEHNLPIQTHLNENRSEIEFVASQFPGSDSYAGVYGEAGLLTDRTVLAHCVHNTEPELKMMKEKNVGISHCPNSNLSLTSGMCDVRRFLLSGFKVGLGTDVSGGYSPTIMDAMRMAATTNRALTAEKIASKTGLNEEDTTPLGVPELIYLATLGGAQVLGLESQVGSLEQGKQFDALLIDLETENSPVPAENVTPSVKNEKNALTKWQRRIEQFLYLGDDRNITNVFVNGRLIHSL